MFKPSPHPKYPKIRSSKIFLTKPASSSSFSFLNCCKDDCLIDSQAKQEVKETCQPKVSMKQLKKKKQSSLLQGQSQSKSRSKSKTKASNKISIQSLIRKNQKQNLQKKKIPSNQIQNSDKEKKNLSKVVSRQLIENKEPPVNNLNTANYVVSQCQVQPQQNNFIFEENPEIKATIEEELNSIFDFKNQHQLKFQRDDQKNGKNKKNKKEFQSNLKQQLRSYANFSFGQRQKQEIFNKYLNKINNNMKKSSNLQSQKSKAQQSKFSQPYEINQALGQQLGRPNIQEKSSFLRYTFQKESLNQLVNKVGKNIFRSESQHTEQKESMIIDTYKSISEKCQNSKEIHLVS